MEVAMIGLDIAKDIFQVRGVAAEGRPLLRSQLRRRRVVVSLPTARRA